MSAFRFFLFFNAWNSLSKREIRGLFKKCTDWCDLKKNITHYNPLQISRPLCSIQKPRTAKTIFIFLLTKPISTTDNGLLETGLVLGAFDENSWIISISHLMVSQTRPGMQTFRSLTMLYVFFLIFWNTVEILQNEKKNSFFFSTISLSFCFSF